MQLAFTRTDEDNAILKLLVKESRPCRGHTVVQRDSGLHGTSRDYLPRELDSYFLHGLGTNSIVVTNLVDRLLERNKQPVRLSIRSSPEDGFIVDHGGKHEDYFCNDGGKWEDWRFS